MYTGQTTWKKHQIKLQSGSQKGHSREQHEEMLDQASRNSTDTRQTAILQHSKRQ